MRRMIYIWRHLVLRLSSLTSDHESRILGSFCSLLSCIKQRKRVHLILFKVPSSLAYVVSIATTMTLHREYIRVPLTGEQPSKQGNRDEVCKHRAWEIRKVGQIKTRQTKQGLPSPALPLCGVDINNAYLPTHDLCSFTTSSPRLLCQPLNSQTTQLITQQCQTTRPLTWETFHFNLAK